VRASDLGDAGSDQRGRSEQRRVLAPTRSRSRRRRERRRWRSSSFRRESAGGPITNMYGGTMDGPLDPAKKDSRSRRRMTSPRGTRAFRWRSANRRTACTSLPQAGTSSHLRPERQAGAAKTSQIDPHGRRRAHVAFTKDWRYAFVQRHT
jgi:hypothetical protein